MGSIASQITSLTIVYSTVYSDKDQIKHQSSASLAFVREINRGPVNSQHKLPVTQKMFPFDDVIMQSTYEDRDTHVMLEICYFWFLIKHMALLFFQKHNQYLHPMLWWKTAEK